MKSIGFEIIFEIWKPKKRSQSMERCMGRVTCSTAEKREETKGGLENQIGLNRKEFSNPAKTHRLISASRKASRKKGPSKKTSSAIYYFYLQ